MSYLPYSSKGENMSEYGWIGLAALAAGSILAGKYGYTASCKFIRSRGKTFTESLGNQHDEFDPNAGIKRGYTWYGTAGLAILGILAALGGAYVAGGDRVASCI